MKLLAILLALSIITGSRACAQATGNGSSTTSAGNGSGSNAGTPTAPNPCSAAQLSNVGSIPATCQFYTDTAPSRQVLPANPKQLTNSLAIVTNYGNLTGGGFWVTSKFNVPNDGTTDFTDPYYIGKATDPLVTIACRTGGFCGNGASSIVGKTLHIPAAAQPEHGNLNNGDNHIVVLDVSNPAAPLEWYLYQDFPSSAAQPNTRPLTNGQTFWVSGGSFGDPYNGDGWRTPDVVGSAAQASGGLIFGMIVRASEINAGLGGIGHAINFEVPCTGNLTASVYPATATATQACGSGVNDVDVAPLGTRWWWDETCATINARTLDAGSKAILCAMHTYGGFETDTNGISASFHTPVAPESAQRYLSLGNPDVTTSTIQATGTLLGFNCGANNAPCYQFNLFNLTLAEIKAHLHALDPCVTQGTLPC